jgi:choline dehydrogenase
VGVKCYDGRALADFQLGGAVFVPYGRDGFDCAAIRPGRMGLPDPTYYYASDEVILSAGAIQSPTILMRSGIGPAEHLREHGIEVKLDAPGVGQDLIDHHEVSTVYEFDPTKWISRWQADFYYYIQTPEGPLINLVPPGPFKDRIVEAHNASQFSSFFSNTCSLQLELKTDVPGVLKDIDVHNVLYDFFIINLDHAGGSGDQPYDPADQHHNHPRKDLIPDINDPLNQKGVPGKQNMVFGGLNPENPRVFMTWLTENLLPGNVKNRLDRGSIKLRDSDFRSEPLLTLNLYKDEEGISRMIEAVKTIRTFMNRPEIKQYAKNPDVFEIIPGPKIQTDDEIREYIKRWSSFGHHLSGGCQMGLKSNKYAVVDSRLRVHGVKNLRIIDVSVYPPPFLHGYNTARGAFIIGEVGSAILAGTF